MTHTRWGKLQTFLESPKLAWWLALIAVLLTAPSLWSGYYQDDHLIRLRFQDFRGLPGVEGRTLDTCVFGDGDAEHNRALMERGVLPWWAPSDWQIAFWRPLSSLTHWIDWQLFGDRAWVMHLHSILWYGALAFVLTRLYGRFLTPGWVAGLAALLFAIDAAHALPVSWIASRNAALSSTFIVSFLYVHDRWRRDDWRPGPGIALALLAAGLLVSEAMVAAGAYLFAYALFVDPKGRVRGIVALLPYLGVVIVWRVLYESLGYGVAGSLLYTDPLGEPIRFTVDTFQHLPLMLFCQFGAADPAVWSFLPVTIQTGILVFAWAFLLLVAVALYPLVRRDGVARFWVLGMILSTLPVCTTIPQGRELMNPGIGAMALVAQFIGWRVAQRGATSNEPKPYRSAACTLFWVWIVLHGVVSLFALPINSYTSTAKAEGIAKALNDTAPADDALTEQTLIVVNTPADLLVATLPVMRAAGSEPVPASMRTLSAGVKQLQVERRDERTLVLHYDDAILTKPWCQVFRNPFTHPMKAGQTIELTGLTITVEAVTEDGRPTRAAFVFDRPLEDAAYRWIVFKERAYTDFALPAKGETVEVRGLEFMDIARWFLSR